MNRKGKGRILWIGAGVVIVAAVVLFFVKKAKKNTKQVYLTEQVSRGDMENSVTATGTVEPLETVEVGTQVSGIIDKIFVDYNSVVQKGQVIAELDKTVLETEYASAKLNVESSRNEYEYQKKNFERTKSLYEKKMMSESEYETDYYAYQKALIAYKQAQAQEDKALTNLGYATITSPINGIVISKAVEVGQTVASSFNTPTLFTIANDLHRVQVVADVDEADIGQVSEGEEVSFTVDAYPTETFTGVVNQVRMEAITTNNVVTYEVVIHAENPDLKLKPGLTANISIYTMRRLGALRVPVKATRFRPPFPPEGKPEGDKPAEGKPFHGKPADGEYLVFVLPSADNVNPDQVKPEARRISTGETDRIYFEVLDGLKEGETVCVGMGTQGEEKQVETARSPFMPGPPGRQNNRNSQQKRR